MKRGLMLLLPLLVVAVTGCPRQTASKENGPAELKRFASASELKQYLTDQYQQTNRRGGFLDGLFGGGTAVPTASNGAEDATGSKDYSGTNVQEEGVDESDVIKTDGTYLYVLANQKLDIIQAVPAADMKAVGHLDLDLPGSELYLGTGKAIILGQPSYYMYGMGVPMMGGMGVVANDTVSTGKAASVPPTTGSGGGSVGSDPNPGNTGTGSGTERPWLDNAMSFDVYVVDVSNPATPSQAKKYSFEGQLITSRMIGTKLYLVSYTWPTIADPVSVAGAAVEDILPKYRVTAGSEESVQPLVAVADVYHPVNPDGYSMINVTTIETADLEATPVSTGIMAGYGVIYASTEALYVSSPNYDMQGYARESTDIHKFSLTGDSAQYTASGRILGHLLNQFSMGEKDGFLRVATTESQIMPMSIGVMIGMPGAVASVSIPATENHVFVLEQASDKLEIAGQINGIAKGEQLYAARFVGDRGFLVTFQRIDPLFTVDLADPHNPKIVGELKVPGYSEYIHMLDDNHLLTIGKDAQEGDGFAWYMGLKLSIFDVTDLANPTLLQDKTIGVRGSDSEALYNHKAFTYHNGLLAFPVDLYEGDTTPPSYGSYTFGGLMVYRVSLDKGFEELGRISTVGQIEPYYWSYNQWTRGIFIGDSVYAACDHDIKAAAVTDMSTLESTVDLP